MLIEKYEMNIVIKTANANENLFLLAFCICQNVECQIETLQSNFMTEKTFELNVKQTANNKL